MTSKTTWPTRFQKRIINALRLKPDGTALRSADIAAAVYKEAPRSTAGLTTALRGLRRIAWLKTDRPPTGSSREDRGILWSLTPVGTCSLGAGLLDLDKARHAGAMLLQAITTIQDLPALEMEVLVELALEAHSDAHHGTEKEPLGFIWTLDTADAFVDAIGWLSDSPAISAAKNPVTS